MSWNNVNYRCNCGECASCKGRQAEKAHNEKHKQRKVPWWVAAQYKEKMMKEEENLMAMGYMIVPCPNCNRDRQVLASSLKHGFSCDKCGYRTP